MNRRRAAASGPWYREPWLWALVAFPLVSVVVASGVTLWLALSNPDHIVVEEGEYNRIKGELRAQESPDADRSPEAGEDPSDDG